jgi:hypothetical protein
MIYTDLTFLEFDAKYSTEEACLEAIFQARWPRGFVCPTCGHNDGYRLMTRPSVECCVCKSQKSITAGTIFHKSKTSLRIWFLIIYEMAHDKGGASALRLAKRFGMHQDTIWHIISKVRTAMGARDENVCLAGFIELDEAFFGGKTKRSSGKSATEDKMQVLVLVEAEGRNAGNLVMQVIESDSPDDIEPVIASKVESEPGGQQFRSDGRSTHHVVMNHGHHIDMTPIPSYLKDQVLRCADLAISHAKRLFKGTYHHFCKIHIQRYLDEFCYRWNRRHLERQLATHLIAACALQPAVSYVNLQAKAA